MPAAPGTVIGTGLLEGAVPPPCPPPALESDVVTNGMERVRVSVPYQNSVASPPARACMRMMRGVIDSTISSFSWSV